MAELYVPEDPEAEDKGGEFAREHRHFLLASFVPALTLPVGANPVPGLDDIGGGNFDMQGFQNGWPQERLNSKLEARWLHSDLRRVAYPYVYYLNLAPIFRNLIEKPSGFPVRQGKFHINHPKKGGNPDGYELS